MSLSRRTLIASTAALASIRAARAAEPDPRMAVRSIGNPDAKVTMQEWFSLTCTHCAAWSKEVLPRGEGQAHRHRQGAVCVPGFPARPPGADRRHGGARLAARPLRSLRGNPAGQPGPLGLRAGRQHHRRAVPSRRLRRGCRARCSTRPSGDAGLQTAILEEQQAGTDKYKIDSTPTFVVNETPHAGEQPYSAIARYVAAAS